MLGFSTQDKSSLESQGSVAPVSYLPTSAADMIFPEDSQPPTKLPVAPVNVASWSRKPRQRRTWSLELSKKLWMMTKEYCEAHSKMIDLLSIEDFTEIAQEIDRSPEQCLIKVREIHISRSTTPGVWATAEDKLLISGIYEHMNWKQAAEYINAVLHSGILVRTAKHCKERWNNHLDPTINKGKWTTLEDLALLNAYIKFGDKWSLIAQEVATRNENGVKNRIHSLLHKEKKRYGINSKEEAINRILLRLKEAKVID